MDGETTGTGAPKETFGTGSAAQSEAGHKGADISSGRSKEALQEAGRKAARTRAERYGEKLTVSDPANDDLQVMLDVIFYLVESVDDAVLHFAAQECLGYLMTPSLSSLVVF